MVFYLKKVNGIFMHSTESLIPRYNVNIAKECSKTKEQKEGLLKLVGEISL